MKYFFHQGRAYSADGELPDEVADWMIHTADADVPTECAHCGKARGRISHNGWHCPACRASAVRAYKNPSFIGRMPAGHFETAVMAGVVDWEDRFYASIDRSGGDQACHRWVGSYTNSGYGRINIMGYQVLAHRLVYLLAGGAFGHAVVMHTCDNPACVNPAHLRGGTAQDNVADMHAKGRAAKPSVAHLRDRPNHPRARAVITPRGEFPSAALAADAFGISRGYAAAQAKAGLNGWAYVACPNDTATL